MQVVCHCRGRGNDFLWEMIGLKIHKFAWAVMVMSSLVIVLDLTYRIWPFYREEDSEKAQLLLIKEGERNSEEWEIQTAWFLFIQSSTW